MADISFLHDDAIGYIDEPPSCPHDFDIFGPDIDLPPSDPDLDLDLGLGFCIDSHSMGAAADGDEIDDYSSGFLLADCGEESLVWKRESVFFEDDEEEEIESNSIDLNPIFSEINETPTMDLIPIFEDFEWQQVDRRVDEREAMTIFFDDDMDDDVDVEISVTTEDQSRQISNNSDWEILLNNNTQNSDSNPDEEEDDFEMLAAVEARKPPASKAVIEGLTVAVVMEGQDSLCAICKDEIGIGEKGKFMPCSHFYHGFCIDTWLEMRNTCPVCRHELPTDDDEYERRRVEREDQESRRVGEVRFFI